MFTDFGAIFYLFPASNTCTFYPLALFFTCIFFYNVTCSLPGFWAPQDQDWSFVFTGLCSAYWRRWWHPTPVLLPGKSHGRRSLEGCSPWGREELDTTERLCFHFSLSCIGEGNGNPLQCYCLENPRDGGAWWAAVYGVSQSWTQLKRLSSSSSILYMRYLLNIQMEM